MMNQKEKKQVRENAIQTIEQVFQLEGFQFVGQTKDGALFANEDGQHMTIKPILHTEKFDAEEKLEEFAEAERKAAEKAKEKAEKEAKRKEKEDEDE